MELHAQLSSSVKSINSIPCQDVQCGGHSIAVKKGKEIKLVDVRRILVIVLSF